MAKVEREIGRQDVEAVTLASLEESITDFQKKMLAGFKNPAEVDRFVVDFYEWLIFSQKIITVDEIKTNNLLKKYWPFAKENLTWSTVGYYDDPNDETQLDFNGSAAFAKMLGLDDEDYLRAVLGGVPEKRRPKMFEALTAVSSLSPQELEQIAREFGINQV